MKPILTLLALLTLVSISFAKAGDPIPLPKQSAAEAVALTRTVFDASSNLTKEWRQRCIVISIIYSSPFKLTQKENKNEPLQNIDQDDEWSWFVTFIHPEANDVSFTYRVRRDGRITLYRETL